MNEILREQIIISKTPLADDIADLSNKSPVSFHTLPLSCGGSLQGSRLRDRYENIFGANYFNAEMTVTGKFFDSFFFAENSIKKAESLTASLYGANDTLFVTSGTTVSNQIAIDAMYQRGTRVLLDKSCHQSMHFMLQMVNANISYIPASWQCKNSGKQIWCIKQLLDIILDAQRDNDPYTLIILNAHSYDGVVYDIPNIIAYLLDNGAEVRSFLIDEAWGSANYFNNAIKPLAAMNVGQLLTRYPDLDVVATHSAHKSLSCLRQASMIHYRGNSNLGHRLRLSRFRMHTTSPSYPILASLDLGRAQMQEEGDELLSQACALAKQFQDLITTMPGLSGIQVNKPDMPPSLIPYAHVDPTKISVNIEELSISSAEVKDILYLQHGIYVNRITDHSLLFNFHIGITPQALEKLIDALVDICALPRQWPTQSHSKNFIIPYPPGVPLVVPGEPITEHIRKKIRDMQSSGVHIFCA